MKNLNVDYSFQRLKILTCGIQSTMCLQANSQARCSSRLCFPFRSDHDEQLEEFTLYEHVIVRRNVGKTRLTLYEHCKVRRSIKKARLIQHLTHVRKNVCKRRLVSYKRVKQLTIKTNGKNSRRFDRSSVIIKRNVENMNLHRYVK